MSTSRLQSTPMLVAATVAAAIGVNVLAWTRFGPVSASQVTPAVAIFAVLLLLLEWRPFPSLSQPRIMVFSWAFAYALLFLVPVPMVLAIGAVAVAVAQIAIGARPSRALFNVGHFQLSIFATWAVATAIDSPLAVAEGGLVSLRWTASVVAGCVAGLLVSSILVGLVLAFHQGVGVVHSVLNMTESNCRSDGPLLVLTPVFVLVGVQGPLLIPLLLMSSWMVINSSTRAMRNEEEATHDELTGLPNRRALGDTGEEVVDVARSKSAPMAVVQLDLDGFKDVNDRLGHKFGDEVLKIVSQRLSGSKRSTDHLFRLGGDEFALVLGGCDRDAARRIAHACLSEIETPMDVEGVRLAISGSLGVATFPDAGDTLADLLHSADLAMYLAKRTGSGVELFSDGVAAAQDSDVEVPAHNDFRAASDESIEI